MIVDVVCVGLSVVNFMVHPVDESIFSRDVTVVSPISMLQGGDAANQAIVLSKLGNKVALCSRRGTDMFGDIMLDLIAKYGIDIDVSGIAIDHDVGTSVCTVLIRPDGHRNFCVYKGAINNLCFEDIDLSILEHAKVASVGGMFHFPVFDGEGMGKFFAYARERGVITVADTKLDIWGIGLEGVRKSLEHLDYFFPSYDEAAAISGETEPEKIAKVFLDAGVGHVGIKLGADGCFMKDAKQEFYTPGMSVDVVDTTGAGDNFMAGFITGLIKGLSLQECCKLGAAAGAICVSEVGANIAVKSFSQIQDFMSSNVTH